MATSNRPLSPHLQVYRLPFIVLMSITHRITGVGLAIGTLLLTYWLAAMAAGPDAYENAQQLLGSIIGRILLVCWTLALFYHLLNGLRHLVWDAGYGFQLDNAQRSGLTVVIGAVVLTVVAWVMPLLVG